MNGKVRRQTATVRKGSVMSNFISRILPIRLSEDNRRREVLLNTSTFRRLFDLLMSTRKNKKAAPFEGSLFVWLGRWLSPSRYGLRSIVISGVTCCGSLSVAPANAVS